MIALANLQLYTLLQQNIVVATLELWRHLLTTQIPGTRTAQSRHISVEISQCSHKFGTDHVFENSQVNFSFFVMPSMSSLSVQQAIIKVQSDIHGPRGKTKVWDKEREKKDVRLEKDRLGEKKKSKRTYQTFRCTQGTTQKQKYFTQLYFHITDNGESFSAAFAWRSNLQQTQNNIIINYAHTRHNNLCSHSSLSVSHNFLHSHTQQK